MELQGKIQRILKSYGVKWSYRVKYKGFKELRGKMELQGKIQRILKSYGVKWNYRVKYKGF